MRLRVSLGERAARALLDTCDGRLWRDVTDLGVSRLPWGTGEITNGRQQQMIDIKSRWQRVTDREKWAARGASFVAKARATKVVWFPPEPVETGKKATKRATKKATGTAKKTTGTAKKVTNPVRRKKT